jgi:oligopeptide transport system permease protein
VNEGADEMDMVPAALLLPGAILAAIIICLTIAGEKYRDHLARQASR